MNIEVIPAKKEQESIMANLLELYAYDFTEFFDFDIGDNGFMGMNGCRCIGKNLTDFPILFM